MDEIYSRFVLTIDISEGETAEKVETLLASLATKTGGRLTRSERQIVEQYASGHLGLTHKNSTIVKPTNLKSR